MQLDFSIHEAIAQEDKEMKRHRDLSDFQMSTAANLKLVFDGISEMKGCGLFTNEGINIIITEINSLKHYMSKLGHQQIDQSHIHSIIQAMARASINVDMSMETISFMEEIKNQQANLVRLLMENRDQSNTEHGNRTDKTLAVFSKKLQFDFDFIKYNEVNKIGEGGYAKFYRGSFGSNSSFHEVAAIKVFDYQIINDAEI